VTLILDSLKSVLPLRKKTTPSGWISVNAPCCSHRGHTHDTRMRGGLLLTGDIGFVWHCFNCGFKAGWQQGKVLSQNTKQLLIWLGMPEQDVQKLALESLRSKEQSSTVVKELSMNLEDRELPPNSKLIKDLLQEKTISPLLLEVVKYLEFRNLDLTWYSWMWSDHPGYQDRLIIPFYYQTRIVGWTARKITQGRPKYLANAQPSYLFNLDSQTYSREFVILVEGHIDAIAIDGIASGHNDLGESQCARLKALNKPVIVLPDRDKAGMTMVDRALDNDWMVSFPNWEPNIKDAADAVQMYGRIYTLKSIIDSTTSNKTKIQVLKKGFLKKHGV
jgi:hypothetical protein